MLLKIGYCFVTNWQFVMSKCCFKVVGQVFVEMPAWCKTSLVVCFIAGWQLLKCLLNAKLSLNLFYYSLAVFFQVACSMQGFISGLFHCRSMIVEVLAWCKALLGILHCRLVLFKAKSCFIADQQFVKMPAWGRAFQIKITQQGTCVCTLLAWLGFKIIKVFRFTSCI